MQKIKLGDIISITRGITYKKENASKVKIDNSVMLLRANNIKYSQFIFDEVVYIPCNLILDSQYIRFQDIIISMSSGSKSHVGKVAFANSDYNASYGAFCAKITVNKENSKYIFFGLQSPFFREYIETKSKGTNINNLTQSHINDFEIPLPPLEEQERIVQKLEELFSHLDKGIEELKEAQTKLKVYRQAVLKEAFEGNAILPYGTEIELQKEIYKEFLSICPHPTQEEKIYEEFFSSHAPLKKMTTIGAIFEVEVGSTPKRSVPEYWNGQIHWISSGEVKFNKISSSKEKITDLGLEKTSTNVQPIGTILLAMIGEGKTRGQAAILDIEAAHNQNTAAVLVSKTSCSPEYVYYFFLMTYEETRRIGSGNNQKPLNKERVKSLPFPFTSFKQQKQIVTEIEARLSVCDSVEQTINENLLKAENLRQSILQKAFEGKLV